MTKVKEVDKMKLIAVTNNSKIKVVSMDRKYIAIGCNKDGFLFYTIYPILKYKNSIVTVSNAVQMEEDSNIKWGSVEEMISILCTRVNIKYHRRTYEGYLNFDNLDKSSLQTFDIMYLQNPIYHTFEYINGFIIYTKRAKNGNTSISLFLGQKLYKVSIIYTVYKIGTKIYPSLSNKRFKTKLNSLELEIKQMVYKRGDQESTWVYNGTFSNHKDVKAFKRQKIQFMVYDARTYNITENELIEDKSGESIMQDEAL